MVSKALTAKLAANRDASSGHQSLPGRRSGRTG